MIKLMTVLDFDSIPFFPLISHNCVRIIKILGENMEHIQHNYNYLSLYNI